jgi:hypothetical protein
MDMDLQDLGLESRLGNGMYIRNAKLLQYARLARCGIEHILKAILPKIDAVE